MEGVTSRLGEVKSVVRSSYSIAFIKKHIGTFSHKGLPAMAEAKFGEFMTCYREGDVAGLRGVVTEAIFEGIRKELQQQTNQQLQLDQQQRRSGGGGKKGGGPGGKSGRRHHGKGGQAKLFMDEQQQQQQQWRGAPLPVLRSAFEVVGFAAPGTVVQVRHGFAGTAGGSSRSMSNGYGQVTVLLHSLRRVVQVDCEGRVVGAGAKTEEGGSGEEAPGTVRVPSLLVFEAPLSDARGTWRIARIEELGHSSTTPGLGAPPVK